VGDKQQQIYSGRCTTAPDENTEWGSARYHNKPTMLNILNLACGIATTNAVHI
jgi:hypothetical protein